MFLVVLTRRIPLKIKASLVDDHFLYSHDDPAVLLVTLRVSRIEEVFLKCLGGGGPCNTLASYPGREGGVVRLLVASCNEN